MQNPDPDSMTKSNTDPICISIRNPKPAFLKQQFIQDVGLTVRASVADPDTFVFGPPGSGSFYHRAKIVKKPDSY